MNFAIWKPETKGGTPSTDSPCMFTRTGQDRTDKPELVKPCSPVSDASATLFVSNHQSQSHLQAEMAPRSLHLGECLDRKGSCEYTCKGNHDTAGL